MTLTYENNTLFYLSDLFVNPKQYIYHLFMTTKSF